MEQPTTLKRSFAVAALQSVEDQQDVTISAMMAPNTALPGTSMNGLMPTGPVGSRETSPLSSVMSSLTRENSALPAVQPDESTANQQPSPPKRRKLTFAEKEVLRIEKQYKDQQKADERARKEEGKRVKEEERRVKEQEREEKKRLRDAEKQAREEEKQKRDAERRAKEEEKAKKEKVSQESREASSDANSQIVSTASELFLHQACASRRRIPPSGLQWIIKSPKFDSIY